MSMDTPIDGEREVFDTFEAFEARSLAAGFDTALVREWAPDQVVPDHTHPFDVDACVVRGEFWLSVGAERRHLPAGSRFTLGQHIVHAERYGAEGATVWVARRSPRVAAPESAAESQPGSATGS
jgi:hypothetical protein